MGNCESPNNAQPAITPVVQENKIKIDPSKVIPAPQFKKCGADNLNITPHELNHNPNPDIAVVVNNNNIELNNNININNNMNLNNNINMNNANNNIPN